MGDDYIEAWAPVTLLGQIADQPGVIRTRQIVPPSGNHGNFTSQGVAKHGAHIWNQAGYTGKGIKVGIIDSGFEGFNALMGTELPATVESQCDGIIDNIVCEAKDFLSSNNHGTMVAEVIIDVAPDVSLYIANPWTFGGLQKTVDWMVGEGVSVINHSRGWQYGGPGDGTSPDSSDPLNSVDRAVKGGIVWVNSAGNEGQTSWFGSFSDPDRNGYISFDNSFNDEDIELPLGKGQEVLVQLRWEDKWGGADRDFNLLLVDATGKKVAESKDRQKGGKGDIPHELVRYEADKHGKYSLKVVHRGGTEPEWIQLVAWDSYFDHSTGGGITSPSESANPGLLAVGASAWNSVDVKTTSSRGPTPDGRTKPDIVGATCVRTALTPVFCGTSAAAPHVAGLAALVLQRFPDFGPEEVANYLKENAEKMIDSDPNISGHGFAKLPAFRFKWEVSDTSVEAGDSFILTVQMYDALQMGGHGGFSVSFPSLREPGGSRESHSSPAAEVEALDYTGGLSNVTFHQPGATIYKSDNVTRFPADYPVGGIGRRFLVEFRHHDAASSDNAQTRRETSPSRYGTGCAPTDTRIASAIRARETRPTSRATPSSWRMSACPSHPRPRLILSPSRSNGKRLQPKSKRATASP